MDLLFQLHAGGYFVEESTQHLWPVIFNKRLRISRTTRLDCRWNIGKDSLADGTLAKTRLQLEHWQRLACSWNTGKDSLAAGTLAKTRLQLEHWQRLACSWNTGKDLLAAGILESASLFMLNWNGIYGMNETEINIKNCCRESP